MLQKNCVIPKNEEVGMGNRDVKNRIERVLVWAEYTVVCHKICQFFKPKTFSIHSVILYQCLYSNLANIREKVISTVYLTYQKYDKMPIHQLLLNVVSDGMSISRRYIYIYMYIHIHIHIYIYLYTHTTHCTKHLGIMGQEQHSGDWEVLFSLLKPLP